jgi:hypothetical protein
MLQRLMNQRSHSGGHPIKLEILRIRMVVNASAVRSRWVYKNVTLRIRRLHFCQPCEFAGYIFVNPANSQGSTT